MLKKIILTAVLLLLAAPVYAATAPAPVPKPVIVAPLPAGFAGQFLAAGFAQSQSDWKRANTYLGSALASDPKNAELQKRAMIFAMGAGDLPGAAARARDLIAGGNREGHAPEGLTQLIVALDQIAGDKPRDALTTLNAMGPGDVTDFIRPLLGGWAHAALGTLDTASLQSNGVHQYNGALIALFLKKPDVAADFARRLGGAKTATPYDIERAGDVLAATGHIDEALKLYARLEGGGEAGAMLTRKTAAVRRGGDLKAILPALQLTSAKQGAAGAVFDLARVLYEQHADGTAEMFANMALALDPGLLPARLLVAGVLARGGNYDGAVHIFDGLNPGAPDYDAIEQYVAELMQKAGHNDRALALLQKLYARNHDLDTLIRIGDLQRTDNKFGAALQTYDDAIRRLGPPVPASYWYLLYARGMCHEQTGNWPKAEADLKAALQLQPQQPYILNYLAYGWAERGLHLPDALIMAKKAAALKPGDGFIADSVGWIEFLLGDYPAAVTDMEKAVVLTPGDATLNEHLGDAYWRAGRKGEARLQWQRALNSHPAPAQEKALDGKITKGLPPSRVSPARAKKS